MSTFTLVLQDANGEERVADVASFVGEDSSGSFGILAGHAPMVASLVVGLARFRCEAADWEYVALPSAVLRFESNVLTLATRHYLRGSDYTRISADLAHELVAEEKELASVKQSLRRMEEELFVRLSELERA
jgi:F-type H+-transporting ATPase subunit epsilon